MKCTYGSEASERLRGLRAVRQCHMNGNDHYNFLRATGIRKPFGEMTNTPPPKQPTTPKPMTPAAAATAASSTPNEEAALTPMANLKLLMKVSCKKLLVGYRP